MKRKKHLSANNNTWYIVGGVAILIIILIIIFSGGGSDPILEEEPLVEQGQETVQEVFEEPVVEEEKTIEARIEETKQVESTKVSEEGLCEDYFFEQGDTLEILDHEITVERIGRDALRLIVDGQNYVLNDGDTDYLGDGIRLSIEPDEILYFAADDPNNAVMIRVGCRYDDNPNEKYVQDRGVGICRALFENCQASFDIELD